MKKLLVLLLALVMACSVCIVPAMAAEKDIVADYFPTGKLAAPSTFYLKETQFEGQATQLTMFYYQPTDLQNLALDIQRNQAFYEQYGIDDLDTFIQVDVKFDDGQWLSTKGEWDALDEYGNINYGENVDANNLTFLNKVSKNNDNADKLQSFAQSWLTYFDPGEPINGYFKPYVKSFKNAYDNDEFVFDFAQHTITYRIRSCVKCLVDFYKETQNEFLLVSDWSPEVAIGKNGTQKPLTKPQLKDAPLLSQFNMMVLEDDRYDSRCFAELPDSIYEAMTYRMIEEGAFEPYIMEFQMKLNSGPWFEAGVANATWLTNGFCSVFPADDTVTIRDGDDVWIRLRVASTQDENEYTPWSNVVGTKPYVETYRLGDVNMDHNVDAVDALETLKAAVKKVTLSDLQKELADVNKNTTINAEDALEILKHAVKKPSCLDKYQ